MNLRQLLALSLVIVGAAITLAVMLNLKTNGLEKEILVLQQREQKMTETIASYEQMFAVDSLLVNGQYSDAVKISEENLDHFKDGKNLVQLRIAVAKKFKELNSDRQFASKVIDTIAKKDSVPEKTDYAVNELKLLDSLSFALEKTKVQLNRLKRKQSNKFKGEYLTFLTAKGAQVHYIGQIKDNKAHGYGIALLNTGSRYEGEWKGNLRHGKGTFYWADGEMYEGEYQNDKREGQGTYYWPKGEKFVGLWHNDERTGDGTFYDKKGEVLLKGVWDEDELVAQKRP